MGRNLYALVTWMALFASCGLEEVGGDAGKDDGVWHGPGGLIAGSGGDSGVGKKVWYAVGVDYPEGYDWRADENAGSVRCSLVVFANGVPMMKVPVGEKYETSSDPDMHRILKGNLYTDFSTDAETVIRRNGEVLFRYPAREMIVGMAVEDDRVYTLGQSRSGSGFSFRVNGEVLLERTSGYAFPHLQRDEDGFSFSFCEMIASADGAYERYYHYLAGEVCQIAVREDVKKVWDVIYHDEKVCYLASMVGVQPPVLNVGDVIEAMKVPLGAQISSCRFVPDPEGLNIEGMMSQRGTALSSILWKESSLVKAFSIGQIVAAVCDNADGICCTVNARDIGSTGIIYRGGEALTMPQGYMSMGGQSVVMLDGLLYVGLTSETGGQPALWVDNEMKPLKINGFISHIAVD